jgi:hypothetical protein
MLTKSFSPFKVDSKIKPKHTKTLYEQRRQLGQCFKYGDKFIPRNQWNVKGI